MNIIKDFMSKPILSIDVNASVEETAKEMLKKGVSCLLVHEKENFVGVITEQDLVRRVIAKEGDAKNIKNHSVMSKPIITMDHYLSRSDANILMQRKKIKHLVVTEQKIPVGILTPKDMTN
jgi:signal-transduction protein with cAMP-binding, CBS, and nucleotidyltransferase domain